MISRIFAAVLLGLAAACSPAPAGEIVVEIDDAFLIAPPEGMDVAGAGMIITVTGAPLKLTGASSPLAGTVEIHNMKMEGDMMRMRRVDSMDLKQGQPIRLEHGGNHLMLFGVTGPLTPGDSADITLTFTRASGETLDIVTEAEIVPPGG